MIQGSEMQASQSKARDYDDGEKVRDIFSGLPVLERAVDDDCAVSH